MKTQTNVIVDDRLIAQIVKCILSAGKPEKIVLFGSHARNEAHPDSDIDIVIVEQSSQPRYQRSIPYRKALRGFYPSKDILVWTPSEIDEWKNVPNAPINTILSEGKILYEKPA